MQLMTSRNVNPDDVIQQVAMRHADIGQSGLLTPNGLLSDVVRALGFRNIARNRLFVYNVWNRHRRRVGEEQITHLITDLPLEEECKGRL